MYYCIKNVNETRTLSSHISNIDTIIIGDRGDNGSKLKIYDSTGSTDDAYLACEIDIANSDNLLQFICTALELNNGFTYVTSGNPGNITIIYR